MEKEDNQETDDLQRELLKMSNELFDEEVWNVETKEEMRELSKRDLAKTMFGLGFVMHQRIMDEEIKDMESRMLSDPELAKSIESFKKKVRDE